MVFHILFFITLTLTACGLFKEKETVRLSLPEKVWADVGNLDRIPVGREVLLVIEVPLNDRIVSFTVNGVEKKGEVNSYMYKFKIYQNTNVALKLESEVKDKKDKSNISSGKTPQEIVEGDIYNFDYMKRNIEPKYQGYNPRLPNKGVFGSEITYKSTEPELVNDKGILIGIPDETKRVKIIATFTYENATGDLNIYVNVKKEAYKYTPFAFEKEIEENEKLSDTNLFKFKLVNDQEGDYYIFEGIKRNELDVDKIKEITIPSIYENLPVKVIGQEALANIPNLLKVKLPNTIKTIGILAFYGCTNLQDIVLPQGLFEIKNQAFYGCTSLTQIGIPKSATYLHPQIFKKCYDIMIFMEEPRIPFALKANFQWKIIDVEEDGTSFRTHYSWPIWGGYNPSLEEK